MRSIAISAVVLTLTGCAITSEQYLADGSKGYGISCNGLANSINTCFEKAGQLCGSRGYEVLNRDGSTSQMAIASGSAYVNSAGGYASSSGSSVPLITRNIMVKCKDTSANPTLTKSQ